MNVEQIEQASLWGEAFELNVKRGVLQYLVERSLINPHDEYFAPWRSHTNADLNRQMLGHFKIADANLKQWLSSMTRHLSVLGYGLGWTAMRECLKESKTDLSKAKVEAIWCPFLLPGESDKRETEREKAARAFHAAFQLPGRPDFGLLNKGMPGRADFILWLVQPKSQNQIICLEFSYNAPLQLADFTQEKAHRDEVARYARYMEARGVFSRVCAELDGSFELASRLEKHLYAFSSSDKPLFKLCQASSYTERLLHLLQNQRRIEGDCTLRAIAITSYGCESIAARCTSPEPEPETLRLMKSLGRAYREAPKPTEERPDALQQEIATVFNLLLRSLPAPLKAPIRKSFTSPNLRQPLHFRFEEEVEGFFRPTTVLDIDEVLAAVEETEALKDCFSGDFSSVFRSKMLEIKAKSHLDLRKVHQAAAIASLECAGVGKLNLIALEGNPGIGKTTALIEFLKERSSFLFLYLSPRVAINRDVTCKLSREGGKPTGIAAMTANSNLIAAAPEWCHKNGISRKIDSGVTVDGADDLKHPQQSIFFFTPSQEAEIEERAIGSTRQKSSISEREDKLTQIQRPGVLKTLSTSAQQILENNPQLNRLVLTGAIQGYRSSNERTTVQALDNLFQYKADTRPGLNERRQFAERINTIIVMVDELAGDGAGSPLVYELVKWLEGNFLKYFHGDSPFKVILILADASLSNEVVFSSFLAGGYSAPDKVLISESRGKSPFRLTANYVKLPKKYPTVHIMTNSYPASQLKVEYSIRLTPITPITESDGKKQLLRQAIKHASGEELLENACQEIKKGLDNGAEQIVFFAQDKAFLREVKQRLIDSELIEESLVAVLDQSTQMRERMELIQESRRDRVKVFLMTSSGARGISFPKTSWIIASIPRFNLETALMEVAQLIYRGRGMYTDSETGAKVSGDEKDRKLVMLIQDFVVLDEEIDLQRVWLRQSSDLLTLLVMLRATILTRITEDAGLTKKSLSFVPVGAIGDEDMLNLMSADLQTFLREARVFIREPRITDNKGIVKDAEASVLEIFSKFDLIGKTENRQAISYTDRSGLEMLVNAISRLNRTFL